MSVVLGYIFLFINMVIVIAMTTDKFRIYLDLHSFICVFGGTMLSAIVGFGGKSVKHVVTIYVAAIKKKFHGVMPLVDEIVKTARETKGEINANFVSTYKTEYPFFKDGLNLISDGFSKEQIQSILEERLDAVRLRYKEDERMIKALAKVPPSFGLLGTTIGLIALFSEVGGPDAMAKIGPAMSVALTATLYGVLFAFTVFNPMLERVMEMSSHDILQREVSLKGILLLKSRVSPVFVEEMLKSHATFAQQNKKSEKK
jgi:chemotaxis protein MotA